MFRTPLTEMLGCRYPVIQTAMGWVSTSQLVIASTKAGAFGFLAAAVMRPEEVRREIEAVRAATGDAPFGVNIHSFQNGVEQIAELCIEYRVRAVSYGRAPSAKLIERLKSAGVLCVPTIGAAKHARRAVELGADLIVCQGSEGGGHTGTTPTWLLLDQVMSAVEVPVVPAGGFRDGRGLAAALSFGAAGIAMGTRFMLTTDSPTPEATKARYLGETELGNIQVSTRLDGLPQRMIRNEKLAELESAGPLRMLLIALGSGLQYQRHSGASLWQTLKSAWAMSRSSEISLAQTLMSANAPMIIQRAMVDGRPAEGVLPSGQVAGNIDDLPSCEVMLAALVSEARASIAQAAKTVEEEHPSCQSM